MKKIIAVTSCPTGIAHTYMASESLEEVAKKMNLEIKVETQGSVGVENELSDQDIKEADAVIIAADTNVSKDRFSGKPIVEVAVADAIDDAKALIKQALAKAENAEEKEEIKAEKNSNLQSQVSDQKAKRKEKRSGPYKHLMTGVSFMLPFVVAGGLAIALSFVFGINAAEQEGTLAAALMKIGGGSAFALMVPILAGYIAFSIADRPGIAPGMIGGMLASDLGAGFLGGIIAGFLLDI